MTKKKEGIKSSPRAGWLRLSLELIAVFVGITAGFFLNNYQESKRDQKLELIFTPDTLNQDLLSKMAQTMP